MIENMSAKPPYIPKPINSEKGTQFLEIQMSLPDWLKKSSETLKKNFPKKDKTTKFNYNQWDQDF